MKKAFRLIGTGLTVLAVCCSFMACSSDDDDNSEDGITGGEKRLKKIVVHYTVREPVDYGGGVFRDVEHTEEYRFEYDYWGRIVKEVNVDDDIHSSDIANTNVVFYVTYEYGDGIIKKTIVDDVYTIYYMCLLKDGKITKITIDPDESYSSEMYFSYDGNRLKSIEDGDYYSNSKLSVTWNGNNIEQIDETDYYHYSPESTSSHTTTSVRDKKYPLKNW